MDLLTFLTDFATNYIYELFNPGEKKEVEITPEKKEELKNHIIAEIFEDRGSLTKNEVEEIMKSYFNPKKINADSITIFGNFTWADFLKALELKDSITKEEFSKLLEK